MSRVALITPFGPPSIRGNAITVTRIARGLARYGVAVRVWDLSSTPAAALEAEIEAYRPTVVHAFHASRVGPLALRISRRVEAPLVVTLTGTDANHDIFDPARAPLMRTVLDGAAVLVVFHESVGARLEAAHPALRAKLEVVPQAVDLDTTAHFDLASRWTVPRDALLFVFPAGLRPVKRPLFPLRPLGRLVATHPHVRLLLAGPVLDEATGETLRGALQDLTWARHVGAVPHDQIASLLARADVVLNCSLSEGGMPNSVLEALALGRAVLASDIPGNRSVIEHGVTGLLFRTEAEFEEAAGRLVADRELRARLGAAGRALVQRRYPPEREIEGYLAVYGRLVQVPSR